MPSYTDTPGPGVLLLAASAVSAQQPQPASHRQPGQTTDPFPAPIAATEGVIRVGVREFASVPDIDGVAARMMNLVNEPGTRRLFVNDMRGPLYSVSYDGKTVTLYLDINDADVGRERAVDGPRARLPELRLPSAVRPGRHAGVRQVLHLHRHEQPDAGAPTSRPPNPADARTTRCCSSGRRRRRPPRPTTADRHASCSGFGSRSRITTAATWRSIRSPRPAAPEFGLLYIGVADGGSGGDPMRLAQNLGSAFGKILRIDPLGTNSANGKYGIPGEQSVRRRPLARLPEIYAYGVRNPQRFAWDRRNGNMFLADIGQNIVEEISVVTPGANLGWNEWEGSYPLHRPSGGEPREAAQRSEGHLSDRRMGPDRSAAAAQLRRQRPRRLSRHADPAARESA